MTMKIKTTVGGYVDTSICCFFIVLSLSFLQIVKVSSQGSSSSDSCNSTLGQLLNNSAQILFNTSSLKCRHVWPSQGFILRYEQTTASVWSFVLSAPSSNSYISIGFSSDGKMVGSSALVGWTASDGTTYMKKYYMTGQTPNKVLLNQGNLELLSNTSTTVSVSSRLYMAFQLKTEQPQSRVLYCVGPNRILPVSPAYTLTQHRATISTTLNYATGESSTQNTNSNLKRSHGILSLLGWGIIIPIGAMLARYLKSWDPIWFYSHTIAQSLGLMVGLSGIICGFVLEDRVSVDVVRHKTIGIFILILGGLQAFAILARPDKESKVRKYWNWYHYSVGRVLIILAVANIFYGIHLGDAGSGWKAAYAIALATLLILSFLFELRLCFKK